jgi:hypothetical protein
VRTDFIANCVANAPQGVGVPIGPTASARGGDVLAKGLAPAEVAESVFNAIREDILYVVTPGRYLELAELRLDLMRAAAAPDLHKMDDLWRRLHDSAE